MIIWPKNLSGLVVNGFPWSLKKIYSLFDNLPRSTSRLNDGQTFMVLIFPRKETPQSGSTMTAFRTKALEKGKCKGSLKTVDRQPFRYLGICPHNYC